MALASQDLSPVVNRQLLPVVAAAVASGLVASLAGRLELWWTLPMPAHRLQLHEAGVRRLYERLRTAQAANAVLPATGGPVLGHSCALPTLTGGAFRGGVDYVVFRGDDLLEQSDIEHDVVLRSDDVPNGLFSRMAREAFTWPEDMPFLLQFQLLPYSEGLELETWAREAGDEAMLGISLLGG